MNTFGRVFRLTDFGESHGTAMGGVIDGMPPGITLDLSAINEMLGRRRPGINPSLTSARKEADEVEFLSGISREGKTLGTPIGFIIRNSDARSADYSEMTGKFRPNHADYTYYSRYEGNMDWAGGGRASARQTVCRVVGGAVALQLLERFGIGISSEISRIGTVGSDDGDEAMMQAVKDAAANGDSLGGVVKCTVTGLPAGLGNPVYDKLQAMLAYAMLGINAVKGFDYGIGIETVNLPGSQQQDIFTTDSMGRVITKTNNSGGIQGGITNGMPVYFRVWFKPTPTIMRPAETLDTDHHPVQINPKGRHDPCVAIRGRVVVEAMAAMTIADLILSSPQFLLKKRPEV